MSEAATSDEARPHHAVLGPVSSRITLAAPGRPIGAVHGLIDRGARQSCRLPLRIMPLRIMIHVARTRLAMATVVLLLAGGLTAACGFPMPVDNHTRPDGEQSSYPAEGQPTRIAINHNSFEAKHVGHTADGGQFFLTRPFDPGTAGADARDFVALYLFDANGRFRRAEIDAFQEKDPGHSSAAKKVYQQRLQELGKVKFNRIEIEPFSVERFGLAFGLIAQAPTSGDDTWWVTAEPGDYMAFAPPWDLGEYDT
jgi:hypothetical protein